MKNWFVDNVNFCEDYHDGSEKPPNPVYDWFREHWLWPFEQNGCVCCNAVRGLMYGFVVGCAVGLLIGE